jgi:hypothetical protein
MRSEAGRRSGSVVAPVRVKRLLKKCSEAEGEESRG